MSRKVILFLRKRINITNRVIAPILVVFIFGVIFIIVSTLFERRLVVNLLSGDVSTEFGVVKQNSYYQEILEQGDHQSEEAVVLRKKYGLFGSKSTRTKYGGAAGSIKYHNSLLLLNSVSDEDMISLQKHMKKLIIEHGGEINTSVSGCELIYSRQNKIISKMIFAFYDE